MSSWLIQGVLVVLVGTQLAGAGELLKPPAIWQDYDPNRGDFKEEIIEKETRNGLFYRESYISPYVRNEEIRVYCKYCVKEGVANAPDSSTSMVGWGRPTSTRNTSTKAGRSWRMIIAARPATANTIRNTRPASVTATWTTGPVPSSTTVPGTASPSPIQNRPPSISGMRSSGDVLSYLERQKEVDKTRLGARATPTAEP